MWTYLFIKTAQIFDPNQVRIPKTQATPSQLNTALTFVFGLAGAVAALIITIAGFQYVISQGDSQKISKAKNTIIYAGIGLLLALTSMAIVRFLGAKIGI